MFSSFSLVVEVGGGGFSSFSLFTRKPPKNWTAPPKLKSWPTRFNPRLVLPFAPFSPLGRVWFFSLKKKKNGRHGEGKKREKTLSRRVFFSSVCVFFLSLSLTGFFWKISFLFSGRERASAGVGRWSAAAAAAAAAGAAL